MFVSAGTGYWLTHAPMFDVGTPQGTIAVQFESADDLLAAAGMPAGASPNAFTLRTTDVRDRLLADPAVADAQVSVVLPDRVVIDVTQRQPVFALQRPTATYLLDGNGYVLAQADPTQAASLGIPLIVDDRTQFAPDVTIGSQLDPIDLAAMTQLAAITPSLIDSSAESLALSVGDDDGFVLSAQPEGWHAIFGEYTSSLRPTDLIPRQVQCLRSLLGASEPDVTTIYLAPMDERCGTYLPVGTPEPIATPHPTDTPKPAR